MQFNQMANHNIIPVGQISDNTYTNELCMNGVSKIMVCNDSDLYPNWKRPLYDISGNFNTRPSEKPTNDIVDYFDDTDQDTDQETDQEMDQETDQDTDYDPIDSTTEKIDLKFADNSIEYWYHNQTENSLYDPTIAQNRVLGFYYK
jgi:hypothetical protein